MIYGEPGDRNFERLIRFIARAHLAPVPSLAKGNHQPVHVRDLAKAIATASINTVESEPIEVGGCEPISFQAMVEDTVRALASGAKTIPLPSFGIRTIVRLQESLLRSRSFLKEEQILRLMEDKAVDNSRAESLLDHKPREFKQGIEREVSLIIKEVSP